jgi:hypothetical protein
MEAGSYGERPEVLAYRVGRNSSRLDKLEDWRRDVDNERSARAVEFKDLHEDMLELKRIVTRAIWALVGLTLTIAGSSTAIVLTLSGH